MCQNFFVLLAKILAGIHKIYLSQITLSNKVARIKYLGDRLCKEKHRHSHEHDDCEEINE